MKSRSTKSNESNSNGAFGYMVLAERSVIVVESRSISPLYSSRSVGIPLSWEASRCVASHAS